MQRVEVNNYSPFKIKSFDIKIELLAIKVDEFLRENIVYRQNKAAVFDSIIGNRINIRKG
jgi:hypothetical protein